MERPLRINWSTTARKRTRTIYAWYKRRMGISAAEKFIYGILDTVDLLALNPNMGQLEVYNETNKKQYRSFVEHRNHKIIYYIETEIVYIVDIWPCNQDPEDINKLLK